MALETGMLVFCVGGRLGKGMGSLHHDDSNCEGGFGLHAVLLFLAVVDDVAAFGDVPWCAFALVRGVDGVA